MSIYGDFFIGQIYTIVKKTENPNFSFENKARLWQGFVLMTESEGVFTDENGNRYPFLSGDILLLGRGYRYKIQIPNGGSYITSAFDLYLGKTGDAELFPQIFHLDKKTVDRFEELARTFAERGENSVVKSRLSLTSLYMEILRNAQERVSSVNNDAKAAEGIIRQTFRENLPVSEIASRCNISPSYLRAIFTRSFGVSITRYREKLRVEEAEVLIRCGLFTFKEIAEQLGYCDVFHFTKNFTKAKGISPSKYREKYICV